jgi:hypothetical protein
VPVVGDTLKESAETFSLILSAPSNATILDGTGSGKIPSFRGCSSYFDTPASRVPISAPPVLVTYDTSAAAAFGTISGLSPIFENAEATAGIPPTP